MQSVILIVDNDPEVRLLIAETLDAAGFHFYTAVSGDEALLTLEDIYPDLLLLDLTMPGMDGWQVIREIRANPRTRELPIVLMSEHIAISNLTCFGVQANVCKPIDERVMLDILNELLIQDIAA
jgi:CheY-like chemotaxis protein